jgi:predicted tellurium resistance membrane protein TerC
VLGFIKDNIIPTRTGIANMPGIIIMGVAPKFAVLTVISGSTCFTETVQRTSIITDIKPTTAMVIGRGLVGKAGAHGGDTITRTRIPVEAGATITTIILGEQLPVTDTRAHRRRVRHRPVQILAFLKFPLLINP